MGAWLRLSWLDRDCGAYLHPDQRRLAFVAEKLPLLSSVAPVAMLLGTAALALRVSSSLRVAALASWAYALMPLPMQHSRFFVVVPFLALFLTLTLMVGVSSSRSAGRCGWAGLAVGAGLACKISAFPAVLFQALRLGVAAASREVRWRRAIGLLAGTGAASLLAFRLLNPSAFEGILLPARGYLSELARAARLVSGAVDAPHPLQWQERFRFVWPAWNLFVFGLGPVLGALSLVAMVRTAREVFQARAWSSPRAGLLLWVLLFFTLAASGKVASQRYFLPIYPALAVLCAGGALPLVRAAPERCGGGGDRARRGSSRVLRLGVDGPALAGRGERVAPRAPPAWRFRRARDRLG